VQLEDIRRKRDALRVALASIEIDDNSHVSLPLRFYRSVLAERTYLGVVPAQGAPRPSGQAQSRSQNSRPCRFEYEPSRTRVVGIMVIHERLLAAELEDIARRRNASRVARHRCRSTTICMLASPSASCLGQSGAISLLRRHFSALSERRFEQKNTSMIAARAGILGPKAWRGNSISARDGAA
jgi:hypothetical protein